MVIDLNSGGPAGNRYQIDHRPQAADAETPSIVEQMLSAERSVNRGTPVEVAHRSLPRVNHASSKFPIAYALNPSCPCTNRVLFIILVT